MDIKLPIPPEIKINMTLDEIIKAEGIPKPISQNMFKRRPPLRNSGFKRPFQKRFYRNNFRKRRFVSQNWRLRGNGPLAHRYRNTSYKLRAFLERKCANSGSNITVFHRLGWNAAARGKLWNAMHFSRPNRKKWVPHVQRDPQRLQKLFASQRQYTSENVLKLDPSLFPPSSEPVKPLNKINLAKLREALGGQITAVSEEASETGTVVTTITRVDNSDACSSYSNTSNMYPNFNVNPYFNTNSNCYPNNPSNKLINWLNSGGRNSMDNNSVQDQFPMGGGFNLRNQFDNPRQNNVQMPALVPGYDNGLAYSAPNSMGFAGVNGVNPNLLANQNANNYNPDIQNGINGLQNRNDNRVPPNLFANQNANNYNPDIQNEIRGLQSIRNDNRGPPNLFANQNANNYNPDIQNGINGLQNIRKDNLNADIQNEIRGLQSIRNDNSVNNCNADIHRNDNSGLPPLVVAGAGSQLSHLRAAVDVTVRPHSSGPIYQRFQSTPTDPMEF